MIAVVFGVQRTVKKKRELPGQTRRRYARAVRITRRADYTRHVNTVSSRTTAPCRPDTRLQWRFPGRVRTCTLPKTVTAGPPLHRNGPSEPRHRDFSRTSAVFYSSRTPSVTDGRNRRTPPRGVSDPRRFPSKKYHEIRSS